MTEAIRELEQRWAAAERRGAVSELKTLLTDDFMAVGPRGFVLNKDQWLHRYASGDLVNTEFDWEDMGVRVHGPTAIAIGVQSQETKYKGQPSNGRFRGTRIFVKEGDRWLLAGIQLSPMAEAPVGTGR